MYDFWYDYAKLKNGEKPQLCFAGTDSLIVYIKIENIYINIAKVIETSFYISKKKKKIKIKIKRIKIG